MPLLTNGGVVSVEVPDRTPPSVERPPTSTASVTVVRGPRGFPGAVGDLGTEIVISDPAATWTIPVPSGFDRTPNVSVFIGGHQVLADVQADHQWVTVTNPEPMTGLVVLN